MSAALQATECCESCTGGASANLLPVASVPQGGGAGPRDFAVWLRGERVDLQRHVQGLRPFRSGEFGQGPASPSPAQIEAVNQVLAGFGGAMTTSLRQLRAAETRAAAGPAAARAAGFTTLAERGQKTVEAAESIWDFYFQIFSQRRTRVARMLQAADRIALDCYQAVYMGMGQARSIPSPPPFCFMKAGLGGPAIYRRGVAVASLAHRPASFALMMLPIHRLLNPWSLGAICHEAGHGLQSDLGLWHQIPARIERSLRRRGLGPEVVRDWTRFGAEIFGDLIGICLIGPAMVWSLVGVLANSPARVARYEPRDPHPPPLLRIPISLELLVRLGFGAEAARIKRLWHGLYPPVLARRLPPDLVRSFPIASRTVVDAICFTPFKALGGKTLAATLPFGVKEQALTDEAAIRLAKGIDPGIVPARFLIGAARAALDRRHARPGRIARNFYAALQRR